MVHLMEDTGQLLALKDDAFLVEKIGEYVLSLEVSPSSLKVAVVDESQNQCLAIEHYQFSDTKETNEDTFIKGLEKVYQEHIYLQAGYWKKIKLCFKNDKFTFIPKALFMEEHAKDYLSLNAEINKDERVIVYKHANKDFVSVFAASDRIINWFQGRYSTNTVQLVHYTSSLVKGIAKHTDNTHPSLMAIWVEGSTISILHQKDGNLKFLNSYIARSSSDWVYYIMLVINELKINLEQSQLVLWGVDPEHHCIEQLEGLAGKIQIGKRPSFLKFRYHFDEVAEHLHNEVLNTCLA